MKRIVFLSLFLFLHNYCRSQELRFNQLMTKNGLSQNSIFAITQDYRGFMWYGSRFGLNRYDGHRFLLYKSIATDSNTLSDDYILSICSDAQHTLWVGTSNGLNKFNPITNSFKRIYIPDTKKNTGTNAITTIYEDKERRLWIGTYKGLYLLTNKKLTIFSPAASLGLRHPLLNNEILSIFEDHEGSFWIGTNKGLLCFRKHQREATVYIKSGPNSISDNAVTAIAEDNDKNLWFGTETGGLNLINKSSPGFKTFRHADGLNTGPIHNAIRKIIKTKSGELWIGTQEGLSILNPRSKTFTSYQHRKANAQSLNQNSIYSIYEDRNGSIWIGTYYGGINVKYAYATRFKTWQYDEKSPGLNHNVISSIIGDKNNNLWIGTEGGGLNYFTSATRKFSAYNYNYMDTTSLGSNLVKVLYRDKSDNLWIGTHGADLNLFNPAHNNFKHFITQEPNTRTTRAEIVAILEDHNRDLWVGSQTGLKVYKKTGSSLHSAALIPELRSLENKNVKVLFEDSKYNLWIATTTGLYLYTQKPSLLRYFKLMQGSNSVNNNANYINCIQEDSKGNIWIGLYYGGLCKYDVQKKSLTETFTTKDGLPNNNVVGILEDDHHQLWISTSNGLSKFNPSQNTFQTYTTSDGLAGDEFNYNSFFKATNGIMYFGGFNGLTYFHPDEIGKNNYVTPVIFTGLKLFNVPVVINSKDHLLNQDLGFTKKLTFHYDQNVFTIEFSLLNYIKSGKNKYAYKLEGINNDWIESHTPSATYTNLPSGVYTLLVKGANNDGVWSKPVGMQIEILPPLWKTWWAYCLYTILLGIIVFFITRFFYLRGLLLKDEELHQIKLNFFTNVSHEIRTHLTLIMAPVEKLIENESHDQRIMKPLMSIKSNANRLLKLVSELMDFRKAETKHLKLKVAPYDLIEFLTEICGSFYILSSKKNIEFSFEHDNGPVIMYFDKVQMEKVFFNLLSNAFKFTLEGGKITISLQQKKDQVQVSIIDTGSGIAPQYLEQLFVNYFQVDDHSIQNTGYGIGLALAKTITELHNGTIEVTSKPATSDQPGNTCFNITLLNGYAHFPKNYLTNPPGETNFSLSVPEENQSDGHSDFILQLRDNKRFKVLIVEDNPELQQLIGGSLNQSYHILFSGNGLEGWNTAIEEIPDLIISDVMMPEMDGFTLCEHLKNDERTNHIPVILLTAKGEQTDQISGLTLGADIYLTKPFSTKILQLHVRNLLQARENIRLKYSKGFIPEPNNLNISNVDEQFISKLVLIIENHMEDENFGIEFLAEKIGMSLPVLYKKLKAITGLSVNDFSKSIRLKKAAQLLLQKRYTVYEIGYMVGFSDRKYFSKEFKRQFGKTPTDYIK
ncbi:hybrid sensor histidine kinase/response regulator [Pedobacter sp. HMWF019]|uniref:hybrid sensor histidine kinase/response regulator transcription factor n=1 Tax=Pedobacter sp. HMWF019 TaxID=2056856 RepID=UPI000D3372FF|nr:hybrid sensor histidine kinase/response regulator transcription factor [Pedobacter sp. HMWF019]PTS98979.1 hybrid sensor histidine kinase/response regulator [Pedobacter sp. HMWF019]